MGDRRDLMRASITLSPYRPMTPSYPCSTHQFSASQVAYSQVLTV